MSELMQKIILSILSLSLFCSPVYAFLEDTPDKIERSIKNLITSAKQGNTASSRKLSEELDAYQNLDLSRHSSQEMRNYINKFKHTGNVPDYIFERGNYSYSPGSNYIYVTGRSVKMFSIPLNTSEVLTARLNENRVDYLNYLGEWKTTNGESWVFAQMLNSNTAGWLERRNIEFIANSRFNLLISGIKEGLAGYKLTTITASQRNSEINTQAVNYSPFTQELSRKITGTIRSARSGSLSARRELDDMTKTFSVILSKSDLAQKSWSENDSYVQKLIHEGKIDSSFLRAGYKYNETGLIIYTQDNAFIRSEPDSDSAKITKTKAGQALRYLGERLTRSGVKFYLVYDLKGNAGWISERVCKVIPVEAVRAFKAQIESGR